MEGISTSGLLVLAGVCFYAGVQHILTTRRELLDHANLLFGIMCLAMGGFGLTRALGYQTHTLSSFAATLKFNLAFVAVFFALFPWFVADFAKVRPLPWLVGLSATFAVLFVVNFFRPYSLQYDAITALRPYLLPWGGTVTLPVGRNGALFWIAITAVFFNLGFGLYVNAVAWRRDHKRTFLVMLAAITVFLLADLQGILVRAGVFHFIHVGPYGFLGVVIVMSIALSRESQRRFLASERRFRSLVEQSPFSIQVLTANGATLQVNPAWRKLWGPDDPPADYNILEDSRLVENGAIEYIRRGFSGLPTEIPPLRYKTSAYAKAYRGAYDPWVRASIYPIRDEDRSIHEVILIHEDVTDRKRVEDSIRLIAAGVGSATGEQFFQKLSLSLAQVFGADYAFIGLLDEPEHERVNTLAVCAHGRIAPDMSYNLAGTPCANVMEQGTCAYPGDVQRQFPEDRMLAVLGIESYIGTPLFNNENTPIGIMVALHRKPLAQVEQSKEILEIFAARAAAELQRQLAEADVRRMAYEDYLTGLANRARLHELIAAARGRAQRDGTGGALLLVDLDHFKTINDALGHDVGDTLLREVARRLVGAAGDAVMVARFGGDEFVALLETAAPNLPEAADAALALGQRILETLAAPMTVDERTFTVGASIGIALFPEGVESDLDIMRRADMALYQAKRTGRGTIQFYAPGLQAAASERLQLEAGLRRAVSNNELELYYQPQVNASGDIVGAEALIRWHHPELGEVPPDVFIPVAEETGLIHSVGRWVLDQACARLAEWTENAMPFTGHLAVNVCAWQFSRADFVDEVRRIVTAHAIATDRLMLELTESAFLYDMAEAVDKLKALRVLGLKIALDDFGTGYSSLAYLRDLPFDQLKIDKSFVGELPEAADHSLIESMIAIGHHMKLTVVAEGVETRTQRDKLIRLGCERFQGFLFCAPLPAKEFMHWLSAKSV